MLYSLVAIELRIGTKYLANLYVGVPIADKIGRNGGHPSINFLWILARPYKMPNLLPEGKSLTYCSWSIWFFFLISLKNFLNS